MVIAKDQVTLIDITDIAGYYRYYNLQSSMANQPSKPTIYPPAGAWINSEPAYTSGSTNSLYFVDCTVFSDGSFEYSEVSLSTSYEAAKEAYNKAQLAQISVSEIEPELIVGTHGATATATWTGTSTKLSAITNGTVIKYKLSSAGASNVTLNLTLKDGSTTGAKPCYYSNTTRLSTQYAIGAVIDLIYDDTGWRILNPYTNSNTIGTFGGTASIAGTNGIKKYSLFMQEGDGTGQPSGKWSSFTTTSGTGTSKVRNTIGFIPDKIYYNLSSSDFAADAYTGNCYDAYAIDMRYSSNITTSGLTKGKEVYLVGTIDSNNEFKLDDIWWTQTIPTSDDGKLYILLGTAYSGYQISFVSDNKIYVFINGKFQERTYAALTQQNYFWHDEDGAHISNIDHDATTGKNILIDSDSMDIRDGTEVVASFQPSLIELGKNAITSKITMCNGSLKFTGRDGGNTSYNQINSEGCIEISPEQVLYLSAPDIHLWYDRLWMNDITYGSQQLMDYVIEREGTTSIGLDTSQINAGRLYWQKWFSGKLEIWGFSRNNNNAIITASSWANGYESTARFTLWGEWPVHFVGYPPSVSYRMVYADDGYMGDHQFIESVYGLSDSILRDSRIYSPTFKFWRGSTATFGHPAFSFHAVGWWKTPTFS